MLEEGGLRIDDDNLEILLQEIVRKYRYDFTSYSRESLKRRVNRVLGLYNFPSVAELQYRILTDPEFFEDFVVELTVNVTEMFRNPTFYRSLVQNVFPVLAQLPFIRIWHAGCSTGEEVYSLAILLKEANLLDRCLLYGTDLNPQVLEKAKAGLFHISAMKAYSENYVQSGGQSSLSEYYSVRYEQALFKKELQKRMVYSVHNLGTDQSFNAFNLILCRNVLIYFNRDLQERVFGLFTQSLAEPGVLALGNKETIQYSSIKDQFTFLDKNEKIWLKKDVPDEEGV